MATLAEHRSESRLEIDGAKIRYGMMDSQHAGCKFYGPYSLNNISNNGASFDIDHRINKGDHMLVDILIPNEENVHASGVVQWVNPGSEKRPAKVGVQFSQFGWGEPWNFVPYRSRLYQIVEQRDPSIKNSILNW